MVEGGISGRGGDQAIDVVIVQWFETNMPA
jgi:hypothetical protein